MSFWEHFGKRANFDFGEFDWSGTHLFTLCAAICWKVQGSQARIQDFDQGGRAEFWPQGGPLSPQFAQNRGFTLKLPDNCMILKNLGDKGVRAPRTPLDPLVEVDKGCGQVLRAQWWHDSSKSNPGKTRGWDDVTDLGLCNHNSDTIPWTKRLNGCMYR